MRLFKAFLWFLAAVVLAVVFGVVAQTLAVLAMLPGTGPDVGVAEAASMIIYDLQHLGSLFAIFVFMALGTAFSVAAIVYKGIQALRPWLFIGAGVVAMAVMLWAMKQVFFGVDIIAGTRIWWGYAAQLVAGGLAGALFARTTRHKRVSRYALD